MLVRTTLWSGSQEALERWVREVTEKVKPAIQKSPGNVGAYFLVDWVNGKALTMTLWESEEAARATDVGADQRRASTVARTGMSQVETGRYEVVAKI